MAAAAFVVANRREERLFRERKGFGDMREFEILTRYRFSRLDIIYLCELLKDDLLKVTNRSKPIPVLTQVLIGLRYLAKGDFLSEVADLHGVSRSSVCNILGNFVDAINSRLPNIRFPEGQELVDLKQRMFRKCRIPNTVGAIDGTLIPIVAPTEHEEVYICRKNYHAINAQAVVDDTMRFTDFVAKWPGSTHDASVFENSNFKDKLMTRNIGHVLGDSGYPLRTYLLTPLLRPTTEQEERFNNSLSRGRMVVERAFGLLKSRFRCLHRTGGSLHMKPGKACRTIVACARLHNLCIDRNVPLPAEMLLDNDNDDDVINHPLQPDAVRHRNEIIRMF